MDFREIIVILLQIINVLPKRYISSSDESIENLLYFKDCQHKPTTERETITQAPIVQLRQASPQPECAFPKMCCALTCGDSDCGSSSSFSHGRQMEPNVQSVHPMQTPPRQPQAIPRGRRKKAKPPMRMQIPPIGGRRDFGFTRERIKNLISQDDDIRRILKDLVRVTMQKVDLVDMINSRRAGMLKASETSNTSANDDDELE